MLYFLFLAGVEPVVTYMSDRSVLPVAPIAINENISGKLNVDLMKPGSHATIFYFPLPTLGIEVP